MSVENTQDLRPSGESYIPGSSNTSLEKKPVDVKLWHLLHSGGRIGSVRRLRRALKKGISVDYTSNNGQTALFVACYHNKEAAVTYLLKHGADPNFRCGGSYTPVHGACASGNPKILCKLIDNGGDLRLHDDNGHTPSDWAKLQDHYKGKSTSKKILEYIETARMYAMTKSGQDLLLAGRASTYENLSRARSKESLPIKKHHSSTKSLHNTKSSVHSLGFGTVYTPTPTHAGTLAFIPYIAENALEADENARLPSYSSAGYFNMISMKWGPSKVTTKQLLNIQPGEGALIDLLIHEKDCLVQLRHSNILLLMGICNTHNLDSIQLVFERVSLGSLYHALHEKQPVRAFMHFQTKCSIMLQICEAVMYLHEMGYLHCNISSHSVHLVQRRLAKLGNFEYIVERSLDSATQKRSKVVENVCLSTTYNWMAPELMRREPPTVKSDIYSFSVVLWEILTGITPWLSMSPGNIEQKLVQEKQTLELAEHGKSIPKPYADMLHTTLSSHPSGRRNTLEEISVLLECGAKVKYSDLTRQDSGVVYPSVSESLQDSCQSTEDIPNDAKEYNQSTGRRSAIDVGQGKR
ncbi:inactive serine/threonine-protein kinase TEX14-like [Glandiceps talaboti]